MCRDANDDQHTAPPRPAVNFSFFSIASFPHKVKSYFCQNITSFSGGYTQPLLQPSVNKAHALFVGACNIFWPVTKRMCHRPAGGLRDRDRFFGSGISTLRTESLRVRRRIPQRTERLSTCRSGKFAVRKFEQIKVETGENLSISTGFRSPKKIDF